MEKQNFSRVWMAVGEFIRAQRGVWGNPKVAIYDDYVQVTFLYHDKLRSIPLVADERFVYADDGGLAICYIFNF